MYQNKPESILPSLVGNTHNDTSQSLMNNLSQTTSAPRQNFKIDYRWWFKLFNIFNISFVVINVILILLSILIFRNVQSSSSSPPPLSALDDFEDHEEPILTVHPLIAKRLDMYHHTAR
jgi:hypothetical protein